MKYPAAMREHVLSILSSAVNSILASYVTFREIDAEGGHLDAFHHDDIDPGTAKAIGSGAVDHTAAADQVRMLSPLTIEKVNVACFES